MRRFWIIFGLAAQAMFAITVVALFVYLWGGDVAARGFGSAAPGSSWVVVDLLLLLQFAVSHSILLHPWTRKRLSRYVPGPQYGVFFCMATCVSLLVTMFAWRTSPHAIWRLHGIGDEVVHGALACSWLALFYSISLTGFGYQTGWTPWWEWARGRKLAPRAFVSSGAYRYFRHPIYLSFLGLIWFNPTMTSDRFLLAMVWSVYIFIGSELKDRRLEYYLGDVYRQYRRKVPAYPWNGWLAALVAIHRHRHLHSSLPPKG